MITLITGGNGTGKTNLVMKYIIEAIKKGRTVYVDGIPELILNVKKCGAISEWQDGTWLKIDQYDPQGGDSCWLKRDDNDREDQGALIVVDECQRHFRPRHSSKTAPACVAAFEVHRHQGLDFLLITQASRLLDSNVRDLVAKHIHLARTFCKIQKFEWPELGDPKSRTSKDIACRSTHSPIKRYYGFYKSAGVHTKLKQSMPNAVYILPFALVFAGFFAWKAFYNVGLADPLGSDSSISNSYSKDRTGSELAKQSPQPDRDFNAEVNALDQSTADIFNSITGCYAYWKNNNYRCKCTNEDFNLVKVSISACMGFLDLDQLPPRPTDENKHISKLVKQDSIKYESLPVSSTSSKTWVWTWDDLGRRIRIPL